MHSVIGWIRSLLAPFRGEVLLGFGQGSLGVDIHRMKMKNFSIVSRPRSIGQDPELFSQRTNSFLSINNFDVVFPLALTNSQDRSCLYMTERYCLLLAV